MTEITASGLTSAALWVCVLVTAAVFARMIHSIATFRRAAAEAERPRNATAEVFWALVPIIIVVAMAAPAVTSLVSSDPGAARETAQQTRPAPGPDLAGEIPQKPFQEGPLPL
ncbi:heme/copper-type cytochrome/quinol oxidase subunit 2 [Povalibacter uvarum]|uniref:Heme/copper-type cytochrome/quinol oxidase subunit 2 n=1 Tax=Povalibacter uvarum TaxID=732238 RepID=A0A841HMA8_9GAMM|nr:cytochrome c oxidase subunit II transmembrane domain-containing protein [Povalibacter uvarum]MBB6093095.1 heme/copper-type cytochrome/quinol oxidase subunit 2 [Povalibacter uvarum]